MLREKLIVIAASTGGPRILVEIFSEIPRGLPSALVVVQHILPKFVGSFARRLRKVSRVPVRIGTHGMKLKVGSAVLAPGRRHLLLAEDEEGVNVVLNNSPPRKGVIPSADLTMISAAPIYQECLMGVILTGMGSDGLEGFKSVKEAGGITIVEDEESSAVYGMPGEVVKMGLADKILTPEEITKEIIRFSWEKHNYGYDKV